MFLLTRALLATARMPLTLTKVPVIARLSRPAPLLLRPQHVVAFSAAAGLSKEDIKARITDVFKSFEKATPDKVQASSSFTEDLGLDSLDTVEVLMAVEEEFGIEIPDEEADKIRTVQQAIDYIAKTPEAH
ncbi:acyl carrier protein-like protein [Gautieria morchelliformis]|nr:acyl carrier protein-like protein [Gautieria morchelliformis]